MLKLKEVIKDKDKKYINSFMKLVPYGIVLNREFDYDKDELSLFEMNEINADLKQRWLK
jgi:hypothetical protein